MNVTPLIWSAFNALLFFKKTQESTMSDINAVTPNTTAIPEQNLADSAAVNRVQPAATAAETPAEASPRDPMFDAPPARTIDAVEEASTAAPAATTPAEKATDAADAADAVSAAPVEAPPAAPEAVTAAPGDVAAEPAVPNADAAPAEPADVAATPSAAPAEAAPAAPIEIPPALSSTPTADNAVAYPSEADEQQSVHDAVTAGVNDFEQAFDFVEQGIARLGQAAKDELKLLAKKYL